MKHHDRQRRYTPINNEHVTAEMTPPREYFLVLAFAFGEIEHEKTPLCKQRL